MGALDGKVAAITGAGGGIGRAHALLFARHGAKVVVNDLGGARDGTGRGNTMAEKVVAEIREKGGQAVPSYDDVASREGAENIVKTASSAFGRLDVMVNNAGILRDKTLLKMDDEMWDLVVRVHLRGTYLCTQAAGRHMAEHGAGGRIINTTSVSGLMGNFGQANYSAAKAGIYGFTRTASMELAKYKVTVNAIAPVALTRLTEDLPMIKALPNAQDLLAPEHISPVVLFLASDLSAHINGAIVGVQGNQVNLYRMETTAPVTPKNGAEWTPEELKERWAEIEGRKA